MAEQRGTIHQLHWGEIFPWISLVRVFRLAISLRVLVLAMVALVGVSAGWRVVGKVFSGSEDKQVQAMIKANSAWPWESINPVVEESLDQATLGEAYQALLASSYQPKQDSAGPIVQVWQQLSSPFLSLFDPSLSIVGLAYSVLCCLWAALVWALFGGAITRIVALALTRRDQLGTKPALDHARVRLGSYFLAPLMPLAGALLAALLMALLGLLMRFDFGLLVGGLLWPLVVLAGVLLAILLLGLLFGWPLMYPTISTEGTDAFDALSRSYAYVSQRPLHFLFYILVTSILGALGVLVVGFFADTVIELGYWGVGWGMDEGRMRVIKDMVAPDDGRLVIIKPLTETVEPSWTASSGAWLISFWVGVITTLKAAFPFAFFWSATVGIYLLLRRNVDATEMDEVYLEEEEEQYGLPPLDTDTAGVPEVADESAPEDQQD